MSVKPTLKDPEYCNWVKAGLCLLFTREGLEGFVDDEIQRFKEKILEDIWTSKGMTIGTVCSHCKTNDVSNRSYRCPNKICNLFKSEVERCHRHKRQANFKFSWKNLNTKYWCNNHWEVAKGYMPPPGYAGITRVQDTDLTGLLSVIINNTMFDIIVKEDLTKEKNIFARVRSNRNTILHSANFHITDIALNSYIDEMILLLSDPTKLAADTKAQEAIVKLNEIKSGTLAVTDEHEVKVTAVATIEAIEKKKHEVEEALDEKLKDALKDVEASKDAQTQDSLAQIRAMVTELNEQKETAVREIKELQQVSLDNKNENAVEEMTQQRDMFVDMKNKKEKELERAVQVLKLHSEERLEQAKAVEDLKFDLIDLYKKGNWLKTPIFPLEPDIEADIVDLYAKPDMVQEESYHIHDDPEMQRSIDTFDQIFTKDGQACKKIYITGDAGSGKSTLCKRMVHCWCQAHSQDPTELDILERDEQTMLKFNFLFYIALREVSSDKKIEDIIKQLFLQQEKYQKILPNILAERDIKSLIILDGLDEWIYESPELRPINNCTLLTTTRQWKLPSRIAQIDNQIKLNGLSEESAEELIKQTVKLLNRKHHKAKTPEEFENELARQNLLEFRTVPVILKQLICLWHDDKPLGESLCDIYSSMLNMFLEMGDIPCQGNQALPQSKLPNCFKSKRKCLEFEPLLFALGKLSFESLTKGSLVFDKNEIINMYENLPAEDIQLCLKFGILNASNIIGGLGTSKKRFSFLHKTFQEFLAALYVSESSDDSDGHLDTIINTCSEIERILGMSKVFLFLSGMVPNAAAKLSDHVCQLSTNNPKVQQYRQSGDVASHVIISVQKILVNCSREDRANNDQDHFIKLEDAYITRHTKSSHVEAMISENVPNLLSLNIRSIEELPQRLHENSGKAAKLLKLFYEGDIQNETLCSIIEGSKETLKSLSLHGQSRKRLMNLTRLDDQFPDLMEILPHLETINLRNVDMPHAQIEILMQRLSERITMKAIQLTTIKCIDCGHDCGYFLDIMQLENLQTLHLSGLYIDNVMFSTKSLTDVSLSHLRKRGITTLILQNLENTGLEKLSVWKSKDTDFKDLIIRLLPTLDKLRSLQLLCVDVGVNKINLSPKITSMDKIWLYKIKIECESFRQFVDNLPPTKCVHLDNLGFIPPEETAMALHYVRRTSEKFTMDEDNEFVFKFHTVSRNFPDPERPDMFPEGMFPPGFIPGGLREEVLGDQSGEEYTENMGPLSPNSDVSTTPELPANLEHSSNAKESENPEESKTQEKSPNLEESTDPGELPNPETPPNSDDSSNPGKPENHKESVNLVTGRLEIPEESLIQNELLNLEESANTKESANTEESVNLVD